MTDFKKLKKGDILSETQFYVVEKISGDRVQLNSGEQIVVSKDYVEKLLNSGDQFSKEESKTKTQLAELFIQSTRIAMTVCFMKADKVKSKKAYNAELAEKATSVGNDFLKVGATAIENALKNPVLPYIPGEERVMLGYHYGQINELGRIAFIDMEDKNTQKQVDSRTIKYIIVDNIKHSLKK